MSSSFEFPELEAPPAPAQLLAAAESERREAEEAERLAAVREEAFAAGLAAGREELGPAVAALGSAARELREEAAAAAERAERAAAELALRIADKVLGAALEVRPELVLEVTRGALRRLVEPREATLLVSPEDAETVRDAVEELGGEHGAPLAVRAERRVPRGGCIVRTEAGEIDAQIAGQLERAATVVAAELSE
ncbi:MAG TPA: FliH/SctL family protein [Solirubrobacterales bacterium]|nr:FliH/SctL family protein [Solirubrobacterales bacterium]